MYLSHQNLLSLSLKSLNFIARVSKDTALASCAPISLGSLWQTGETARQSGVREDVKGARMCVCPVPHASTAQAHLHGNVPMDSAEAREPGAKGDVH